MLARACQHITDVGTGIGLSAAAFLYAEPHRLVCIDRVKYPEVDRLRLVAGRTDFTFRQTDDLWEELEETDLHFLDTWHIYNQLAEELRLHAAKVRKYLVIHGTTTFAQQGEDVGHRGLWPAIEEFLARGNFYGADLSLQAREHGLATVAVEALCFHNQRGVEPPPDFAASGRVFAKKWSERLPVKTTCAVVDEHWLQYVYPRYEWQK